MSKFKQNASSHRSTRLQVYQPTDPHTHRSTHPRSTHPTDPHTQRSTHPRSTHPTDPHTHQIHSLQIHQPTDPPTHRSTHPRSTNPQIHTRSPPTHRSTHARSTNPQIHPAELPYPFLPALTRIVSVKSCLVILAGPLRWKTSEGEVAACSRHVLRWPMGSVREADHLGHRPLVLGGRRQGRPRSAQSRPSSP